ncbi:MAG TPA: nickel pincer cofactor biosynthesis protein LarC [Lachnospiraceae bacterium]|nr:nickel pincer cofactor biosynthesis protein LarC [Lachnospiraceae bacterium]
MKKILYFDCGMGAAGDMLSAALAEIVDKDEADSIIESVNAFKLPGVEVSLEKSIKCGISGSHVNVKVGGVEEESPDVHEHGHDHEHEHEHDHEHHHEHDLYHHHHTSLSEVHDIIDDLPVTGNVKKNAIEVYDIIAKAESKAHDTEVSMVHFHEVGAYDAICDVVLFCMLMEKIAPDEVYASPLRTGYGHVKCAHGVVPVPAPATAYILEGIPNYEGDIEGELLTPTGAALLKHFVKEFKRRPDMTVDRTGYGMGRKDFVNANCVRAFWGEEVSDREGEKAGMDNDDIKPVQAQVSVLSCNVDDMTGEELGFAIERLRALGALEVFATPVTMKKSRPGFVFEVICRLDKRDEMVKNIFKYTETIGIRETIMNRYELLREAETTITDDGEIRAKKAYGYGIERTKIEYEDAAAFAIRKGISLRKAREILEEHQV